jgi:hypothetical protein
MRIKSRQLILLAAFALIALTHAAVAADNPPFHFESHHIAPLVALNEVVALVGDTDPPLVLPEELETFKKIAAGQASKCDESEGILLASGIGDKATRDIYTAKLKKIADIARKVVALRDTPEKKAAVLALFLFATQFNSGFEDNQANIRTLLDDHKFNCVSSCVLYNLIGNQLGLKTRAVTVPGHVFLRMGDLIIEPVSNETMTADQHQKSVDDRWAKADDHWKKVFGNTRSYESGNLGLVSLVYLDDSIAQLVKNQDEAAVAKNLKAACLDPKNPGVVSQLEKTLRAWFADTLKQKKYDKAQKIAAIYGQLFGDDSNKLFKQVAAARKAGQAGKNQHSS